VAERNASKYKGDRMPLKSMGVRRERHKQYRPNQLAGDVLNADLT